jgi:hypothetical protein
MRAFRKYQAHIGGYGVQPFVVRPQAARWAETYCGEQVRIDIPDATSKQSMAVDEVQRFLIGCDNGLR